MFRKVARALGIGAALGSAALGAQASFAAVSFTFDTTVTSTGTTTNTGTGTSTLVSRSTISNTDTNNSLFSAAVYKATTGGQTLDMRVSAWHAVDISGNADRDNIESAKLGLYSPGLGTIWGNETPADAEHQIDNIGGVDFVMLQFSQAVSLTSLGRAVFAIDGVRPIDNDGAYWADTTKAIGNPANWNSAINIATASSGLQVSEQLWSDIPGTGSSGITTIGSSSVASVWLVGASFKDTRNDGFKISSITVAAVPEPASWAMMIVGFGAVGGTMRRTRRSAPLAA